LRKSRYSTSGPFHNQHEIVFSNDGKGVHLLRGNNGQGKTSFKNAITWCLYEEALDRQGRIIPPTELLNQTSLKDDIYQFGVKIHFAHNNEQWTLTRKMTAKKHQDSKYKEGKDVSITKNGEPQPNPDDEIARIVPKDVSRFFILMEKCSKTTRNCLTRIQQECPS